MQVSEKKRKQNIKLGLLFGALALFMAMMPIFMRSGQ